MSAPDTYGDVTAEYRAARYEAGAVADLYELVWFTGDDAVGFLEGLLSQNVEGMEPGEVRRSLLLGPQGKLVALLWVLRCEDRVGIVTDRGYGAVVRETLGRYRIRVQVDISADERPLLTRVGPESTSVEGWSDGAALTANLPLAGSRRSIITATEADGHRPVGSLAWRAVRVEAGEPLMGVDVDESTIPQESGLVPTSVDFGKGCFLGQELVARIDSRGRVNRLLRGIMLLSNVLPPPGAEVVAGERVVGSLTSPAESLALRAPVGLGLIRHEVGEGDPVTIRWEGGEAPATVAALPMIG